MLKILLFCAVISLMSRNTRSSQIIFCQRFLFRMFCVHPITYAISKIVRKTFNNRELLKRYRNMNIGMDEELEGQEKKKIMTKVLAKDKMMRVTKRKSKG